MDFCATICEIEVEVMWKFISYTIFTWIPVKTNRLLRNTDIPHTVLHLKHYYMIFDTKVFFMQPKYSITTPMYNENDCFSIYFNELNYQSLRLCEQILYKNILLKVFIYYESIVLFKHVFNFLLYYKVLCHIEYYTCEWPAIVVIIIDERKG